MLCGKIFKSQNRTQKVLLLLLGLAMAQCSSTYGLSSAVENVDDYDAGNLGEEVVSLNFSDSASTVDVASMAGDSDVVLMLYVKSESESAGLGIELSASPTGAVNSALHAVSPDAEGEEDEDFGDATENLHEELRLAEAGLLGLPRAGNRAFQASLSDTEAAVGDERSFSVLSSFSDYEEYTEVTATLVYQTANFNYYIDNDALDSLSENSIAELCDNFQGVVADMHTFFGEESDVNGDGRFDILSTPVVNGLGGSPGSVVTGFWFARDLYDLENSNRREVFYTAVPDPEAQYGARISESFAVSNILRGVFPHEFQHMINYNQKVNVAGSGAEESWLNEALSHLSEDIYEQDENGYMLQSGNENPSRVSTYLSQISETCFTCGANLAQRGGSYLFVRYLYEQANQGGLSGADDALEFLHNLVQSDGTGAEGLAKAAVGADATIDDFYDLFGQFGVAVFQDSTNAEDDTFGFAGIDLRAEQDDNRGTDLNGPELVRVDDLSYVDSISGTALLYLYIPAETLADNDGQFTVSYSGSAELAGYLMTN